MSNAFPTNPPLGPTYAGLTKREYFAASALNGLLSTIDIGDVGAEGLTKCVPAAVVLADKLIAALKA